MRVEGFHTGEHTKEQTGRGGKTRRIEVCGLSAGLSAAWAPVTSLSRRAKPTSRGSMVVRDRWRRILGRTNAAVVRSMVGARGPRAVPLEAMLLLFTTAHTSKHTPVPWFSAGQIRGGTCLVFVHSGTQAGKNGLAPNPQVRSGAFALGEHESSEFWHTQWHYCTTPSPVSALTRRRT